MEGKKDIKGRKHMKKLGKLNKVIQLEKPFFLKVDSMFENHLLT